MERYLIKYLRENSDDELINKYVDFFKVELDWFIYNYGEHINFRYRRDYKYPLKRKLYTEAQSLSAFCSKPQTKSHEKNVLSSVSFSDQALLPSLGFNPLSFIFQAHGLKQIIGDKPIIMFHRKIRKIISQGKFTDLYNKELFYELEKLQSPILDFFKKYDLRALLLYTDQYFASKYMIDLFKKLDKPSMVFSHGLPGIYSEDVDNRADYLLVWGEAIKQNYINAGFNSDKVKVVGNSKYTSVGIPNVLRNSLEDILVIPCSSVLWHQHEWGDPVFVDRSMTILYLYQVQRVLMRLGIKKARFRPHPAINPKWIYNFLDHNFYELDKELLLTSLNHTSLVIGSTSTTFLETLMSGVNYLLYEPQDENGMSLSNFKLVPPFDGSIKDLLIARNEEDLEYMIKNKYQSDARILDGYMQPLDLSVLQEIIE